MVQPFLKIEDRLGRVWLQFQYPIRTIYVSVSVNKASIDDRVSFIYPSFIPEFHLKVSFESHIPSCDVGEVGMYVNSS